MCFFSFILGLPVQPLGDSVPSSLASWPHYDCWANFNDAIGLNEIIVSSANKKAHFGIVRGSVQMYGCGRNWLLVICICLITDAYIISLMQREKAIIILYY